MLSRVLLLLFMCGLLQFNGMSQNAPDFTIPVKVQMDELRSSVNFSWPVNIAARSYSIKRKIVSDTSFKSPFQLIATLNLRADTITGYTDMSVRQAIVYEYKIEGTFSGVTPANRNVYLCVGNKVGGDVKRGTLLLLCDKSLTASLETQLKTLWGDLVGDGWKVKRMDVSRSNNPLDVQQIKADIKTLLSQNADLRQIFIIGHVPVPYSGNILPDGHAEHEGAWPADSYYGDMTTVWSDTSTVASTATTRPQNINVPGDGKFDQRLYTSVQIAVGRVDFYNMPVFTLSETDLIKRYLDKNHRFRNAGFSVLKRALIEDNLSSFPEKFSQGAWKSNAATVGFDNTIPGQYDTELTVTEGYLWSSGTGGGSYNNCGGIASSVDFATKSFQTVFTQLFGSYFGDWDSQNNLMRAAIGGPGKILSCVWGGRPQWFFHHMSAGLPIGYSTLTTLNNTGLYENTGYGNMMVHTAMMGDPSLRNSYLAPVKNVRAIVNNKLVDVSWDASDDASTLGWNIYRSETIGGDVVLMNNEPVSITNFSDTAPATGNNVYMVKAVRLDQFQPNGLYPNSSTFYNYSRGVTDSALFYNIVLPVTLQSFTATASSCKTKLKWKIANAGVAYKKYVVESSTDAVIFYPLAEVTAVTQTLQYHFDAVSTSAKVWYRLKLIDLQDKIEYSPVRFILNDCVAGQGWIYPNPVKETLHLYFDAAVESQVYQTSIYDFSGKLMMTQSAKKGNNYFNVSTLATGFYTLIIQLTKGVQILKFQK